MTRFELEAIHMIGKAYADMQSLELSALQAETVEDRAYYFKEIKALMTYIEKKRATYSKVRNKTKAEILEEIPF